MWQNNSVHLKGNYVQLVPLDESHFGALLDLAQDKRIWEHYVFDGTDPSRFRDILNEALCLRELGSQIPFVIMLNEGNKIVGSTRFMDIQPNHKKLEIGFTWLHPDYWGSSVNPEIKYLMLSYCFEKANMYRVQFKTDEKNLRSRNAILKIGAKFEGILRNDMVRDNGTQRNSAYFSITAEEWPMAKQAIRHLIMAAK